MPCDTIFYGEKISKQEGERVWEGGVENCSFLWGR